MRKALPLARLPFAPQADRGLGTAEASAQRAAYGGNDIVEAPRRFFRDLLHDTATDPMIWFLVGTGGLYAALGNHTEAVTLFVALLPLVGLDVFLHWRTQASTHGLRSRLAVTATIVRDGAAREVPATEVVPGDLALVAPGETFPADGVLVGGANLQTDESSLTGEAYPVSKRLLDALPAGEPTPLVEDEAWGMAGTRLLTGEARLRVVFTGAETLYGQIVLSAASGSRGLTPLQRAVADLVATLVTAAGALCLLLGFIRYRQGHGWLDALLSAVTLAVAALPEEFPVALTFFLGVGVYRLARRRALVRRAVCVENIGRTTCICSDKTGTLTEGQLRVTEAFPAPGHGEAQMLRLAAMASRRETADPLDLAVLDRAAGTAPPPGETVATFPFTEDRRRQTLIVRHHGELTAATKGSPEVVLPLCDLSPDERQGWTEHVVALAEGGRKVVACAARGLEEADWPGGEPARGFRFAGLLVCEDAVRAGVPEAVEQCQEAGIHTVMVTGDHPGTARAVARAIGLGRGDPIVISGEEMEAGVESGTLDLRRVDVIARALPAQKLSLVRALQGKGEIVAVTGDGVNDVPALQAADIGIAMGERGTRAAREAASIVLLDDNFRSIVRAIAEGRQLFRNLKLSFAYLLMIHVGLVATATLIPLAGYPLLYLPVHIVWLEMLIHPTAMLVFQELPARDRLDPRPTLGRGSFFARGEWGAIGVVGALLTLAVAFAYDRGLGPSGRVEHARALALLVLTLTSAGLAALLSGLRTRTAWAVALATVVLSLVLLQAPPLALALHVEPLHLDDWAAALGATVLVLSPLAVVGVGGVREGSHR